MYRQNLRFFLYSKKIPLLVGDDVIHGYRSVFPVPIGLACMFDLDLVEKLVVMSTQEASIYVHLLNTHYKSIIYLTHVINYSKSG